MSKIQQKNEKLVKKWIRKAGLKNPEETFTELWSKLSSDYGDGNTTKWGRMQVKMTIGRRFLKEQMNSMDDMFGD